MTELVIANVSCFTVPLDVVAKAHAVITDPPYSPHVHANITSAGTLGAGSEGWHRRELEFEALTPELLKYIAECSSRVSGWSVIFSDIESSHLWRDALDAAAVEYIRSIPVLEVTRDAAFAEHDEDDEGGAGYVFALPWRRWSPPQKSGDRPTTGAELVTHAWGRPGTRKGWNGPGNLTAYDRKALRQSKSNPKHDAEKPLDLMLDLVSWYSNPGEIVYDPCAGAGTTGLACRLLGRSFWGCEGITKWANAARTRLTGPLSDRDRDRVSVWLETTRDEARRLLALKRHPKGADKKTRARAERRLADADTVERLAA